MSDVLPMVIDDVLPPPSRLIRRRRNVRKSNSQHVQEDEELVLSQDQQHHVQRLWDIFQWFPWAVDTSGLGCGKTYTSSDMVKHPLRGNFKHMVIIAPLSVLTKWNHMKTTYNLPIRHALTYQAMCGSSKNQPKHGLLTRTTTTRFMNLANGRSDVEGISFAATEAWKLMISEGVLLVFDEIQSLKNITSQFRAGKALIQTIVEMHESLSSRPLEASQFLSSRALLMSGSPVDKPEQITTLMRTLCIMKSDELASYRVGARTLVDTGINDIREFCMRLDEAKTKEICAKPLKHKDLVYQLFTQVMRSKISSSMSIVVTDFTIEKRNGYYEITNEEDRIKLEEGIGSLKIAAGYNADTGRVDYSNQINGGPAFARVGVALRNVETACLRDMCRVVRNKLLENPGNKVTLSLNYTRNVDMASSFLKEFKPIIVDGRLNNPRRRAAAFALFQAHNVAARLLIVNTIVCQSGIDLDDKDGRFPRFCLASPTYSTIAAYQLGHRFLRGKYTKSNSILHNFYGKDVINNVDLAQVRVLTAISKKSTVMREITPDQVEQGVVFPGDYTRFDEPPVVDQGITSQWFVDYDSFGSNLNLDDEE